MAKKKAPAAVEEKTGLKNANALKQPVDPDHDDWKAEEDARTMMRHGEIMSDKKRHSKAMEKLMKQKMAIRSVEDLKKVHQEKYGKT